MCGHTCTTASKQATHKLPDIIADIERQTTKYNQAHPKIHTDTNTYYYYYYYYRPLTTNFFLHNFSALLYSQTCLSNHVCLHLHF